MEPKQSGPGMGYEQPRVQPEERHGYPHNPNQQADGGLEHTGERSLEARPAAIETISSQPALPSLPIPVLATPVVDDSSTQVVADDTPLVAADDDLIEKEWIDKAKKVLVETKDDPYRREREISKLQIDYIRKRYGREIGDAGD